MQFGNIGTILVFFVRETRIVEYIFSFFYVSADDVFKKIKKFHWQNHSDDLYFCWIF